MKNITLAVDKDVLDRVRVIAAERKTTVNGLREYLARIASEQDRRAEARRGLRELMEKSQARLGPDYKWNREKSMRIECFLDTNILIYAAMGRLDEPRKFDVASALVDSKDFGLSGQVLAEFCVNAMAQRKGRTPLTETELDLWMGLLGDYPIQPVDAGLVQMGLAYSRRFRISYWDAALIAAAERLDAPVLYTEDLNHDQLYGSVRVVNPFRPN